MSDTRHYGAIYLAQNIILSFNFILKKKKIDFLDVVLFPFKKKKKNIPKASLKYTQKRFPSEILYLKKRIEI